MRTEFPASHRDLLDARFATLATIGGDSKRVVVTIEPTNVR